MVITLKNSTISSSSGPASLKPKDHPQAEEEMRMALKVVDGKIVSNEVFQQMDPNSIYSISVWKDEEKAVQKWGEKGRNGVIEITTNDQYNRSKQNEGSNINATGVNANEQNTAFEPASTNATSDTSLVPPQFPGGEDGWLQYLMNNLKSNVPAYNKAPAGTYTTVISFKVDEQGNISDVKVVKDPGFGTGTEAARVIKEGPKWIPAQEDGHAVTAMTKQAITFRIEEGH